jgi:bacterioferritin-associated ferredoxin
MTKFSDLAVLNIHQRKLENPSASIQIGQTNFALRFDAKDKVMDAGYQGPNDPWLNVLCHLLPGLSLAECINYGWSEIEKTFKDDQFFWDLRTEENESIFFRPFEILKATLDVYRGREYLYREASPLICRCFGVRESDVVDLLKTETEPTLEALSKKTKAGMGCRSCVPQLSRWLAINAPQNKSRFYKERPIAEWKLDIDSALTKFFEGKDWNLEVHSFKGQQVIISFDKIVSQKEEEIMAVELQGFLGKEVDSDLAFFLVLIRDLQALKADR